MKKIGLLIFNVIMIIYLELIYKGFIFNDIFSLSTLLIILFSIFVGLFITILEGLGNGLINKIITFVITLACIFLFVSQFIYYRFYQNVFSIYSLFHGGQVLEFLDSIFSVILKNLLPLILMLMPLILLIIFMKKLNFNRKLKINVFYSIIFIIIYLTLVLIINIGSSNDTYSIKNLYYSSHVPDKTVRNFGVLTEMRLDLQRYIFGFKEKIIIEKIDEPIIEEEIKYHMMDIDFDTLIENETDDTIINMHEYFKSIAPTATNEYTGMFEGKNLIVIVAEAFSPMAIDEKLTPTLYKLYNEGFKFTNFYSPVFYVSTSDGEFVTLTSLLPRSGVWSMARSSKSYMPFAYGNLFKSLGYETRAYHDGTYTYYNRHLSLPNMGYDYKSCYHGIDINCKSWPQSDVEMINATADEFINSPHYMTYYMTISGHMNYNFMGNNMASKNKKYVNDLDTNDSIKAYLATQIELDRALEALIKKLEENGTLSNTVISLSTDHYPYGLTNSEIKSYATYIKDEKYDIHKNAFLLWNSEMKESITVDKYASSLDILPTMLNLFNIEFDSRLLMGNDIFSDKEGLIIFNDRSFISSKGKYNAGNKKFTSFGEEVSQEYIDNINKSIYNKFLMSKLILDERYYNIIFNK